LTSILQGFSQPRWISSNFEKVFNALMQWPETFKPLRKVEKILQDKIKLQKLLISQLKQEN
jgi:hypothetical protein